MLATPHDLLLLSVHFLLSKEKLLAHADQSIQMDLALKFNQINRMQLSILMNSYL
jgi:hypothetical protein